MTTEHLCYICRCRKPCWEFHADRGRYSRKQSACKTCTAVRDRYRAKIGWNRPWSADAVRELVLGHPSPCRMDGCADKAVRRGLCIGCLAEEQEASRKLRESIRRNLAQLEARLRERVLRNGT